MPRPGTQDQSYLVPSPQIINDLVAFPVESVAEHPRAQSSIGSLTTRISTMSGPNPIR